MLRIYARAVLSAGRVLSWTSFIGGLVAAAYLWFSIYASGSSDAFRLVIMVLLGVPLVALTLAISRILFAAFMAFMTLPFAGVHPEWLDNSGPGHQDWDAHTTSQPALEVARVTNLKDVTGPVSRDRGTVGQAFGVTRLPRELAMPAGVFLLRLEWDTELESELLDRDLLIDGVIRRAGRMHGQAYLLFDCWPQPSEVPVAVDLNKSTVDKLTRGTTVKIKATFDRGALRDVEVLTMSLDVPEMTGRQILDSVDMDAAECEKTLNNRLISVTGPVLLVCNSFRDIFLDGSSPTDSIFCSFSLDDAAAVPRLSAGQVVHVIGRLMCHLGEGTKPEISLSDCSLVCEYVL